MTIFSLILTEQFLLHRGFIVLIGRYTLNVNPSRSRNIVAVSFATVYDLPPSFRPKFALGSGIVNSMVIPGGPPVLRHLTFTMINQP